MQGREPYLATASSSSWYSGAGREFLVPVDTLGVVLQPLIGARLGGASAGLRREPSWLISSQGLARGQDMPHVYSWRICVAEARSRH